MILIFAFIELKEWIAGERFSVIISPILIVMGALLLLVFMFAVIYHHYRFSKHVAIFSFVALLTIGGVFYLQHNRLQEFYTVSRGVLPNIRDRELTFTGYEPYDEETINSFKRFQNRAGIEALGMYTSHPVSESVDYLGTAYDSYYFLFRNQVVYLRDRSEFTADKEAKLTGIQYTLEKNEFAKIGFLKETNHFLDVLKIPETQKELLYEPIDGKKARPFEIAQSVWATYDEPQ